MTEWMRYGWPRWYLVRLCGRIRGRAHDRLLDFLYPDDVEISFAKLPPNKRED